MGKGRGHIPIRTCVSCGSKREKGDLIRLSLDKEGRLLKVDSGKNFGRGAYVCREMSCRKRLLKNKRLSRLFRSDGTITVSPELERGLQ